MRALKVEGEDPDTPDYLRGDRVSLGVWFGCVRFPWLAHDEAPGPF